MDNFDLDALWEEEQPAAHAYFEQVAPQLQQVIQQGSQHALQKLRKTIVMEWAVGGVAIVGLFFFYRQAPYFGVMAIVTLSALALGAYPYWNLWQKIKAIPTQSLQQSLQAYLEIVRLFIKRIEWFCLLGTPVGAAIGMYIGMEEEAANLTSVAWFWIIVVSLVVGLLFYFPMKYWYIPALYGRTEKHLESLLKQLETEA